MTLEEFIQRATIEIKQRSDINGFECAVCISHDKETWEFKTLFDAHATVHAHVLLKQAYKAWLQESILIPAPDTPEERPWFHLRPPGGIKATPEVREILDRAAAAIHNELRQDATDDEGLPLKKLLEVKKLLEDHDPGDEQSPPPNLESYGFEWDWQNFKWDWQGWQSNGHTYKFFANQTSSGNWEGLVFKDGKLMREEPVQGHRGESFESFKDTLENWVVGFELCQHDDLNQRAAELDHIIANAIRKAPGEPDCHCKHLALGHDPGCEWKRWKEGQA